MAYQGTLVRVDRGDGILIKMKLDKAQEYVEANSNARIVATPASRQDAGEQYDEFGMLIDADDGDDDEEEDEEVDLESMTREKLEAYAAENDIDVSGARTKADVINIIQEAESDDDEDDEDDEG